MKHSPFLLPAIILTVGVWASDSNAQVRSSIASRPSESGSLLGPRQTDPPLVRAAQMSGRIEGTVTDDEGKPLIGVAITAHGPELLFAVTDRLGRFKFDSLQEGPYIMRAHSPGFAASRRELVEVRATRCATKRFRLTRTAQALPARPVLAAGVAGAAPADAPEETAVEESDHSHSPTAWRIRHLKRSVLREDENGDFDLDTGEAPSAADTAHALSFIEGAPFSAQVQFLTISAFDSPEELFTAARVPHGVAYVALSAPVGRDAIWAVQGALTQGDVSSWVLGGSYVGTVAGQHQADVGMSYAAQRYEGGNPVALASMGDTSRTVGALHAFDRWSLTPAMSITSGGRFAHYGYIDSSGLFSPSLEWRWQAKPGHTVRALVSQQMLAPGAEEFVPSPVAGLWMPPQRTFSPLVDDDFRAERTRHMEVGWEQEVASFVVATRGFRQVVNEQIVTVFGLRRSDTPRADLGHYYTASAGNVEAYGWGVSVSRPVASRLRGSVSYTLAHTNWPTSPSAELYEALAQSSARAASERIHDLTAMVETTVPETATRVVAVYKLNSSYSRDGSLESTPGPSGRFDVQVNQRLPFVPLGDAEWELLVAVRNLFRDPLDGSSIYDELLVVRPPKRIIGGLMIRF